MREDQRVSGTNKMAISDTAMHALRYQKKPLSCPDALNQRATYSADPEKMEELIA